MYSALYSATPRAYSSSGFAYRTSSFSSSTPSFESVSYTPLHSLEAVVASAAVASSSSMTQYQSSPNSFSHSAEQQHSAYTRAGALGFTYETKVAQYFALQSQRDYHRVESFLKPYRPATQFIAEAASVENFVKEAFAKTTGEELPENIVIRILGKEEMAAMHESAGGKWSDTIQGFSLNTKPYKQVFVKQAPLDQVMVVLGHEIGHVLTASLGNAHDEEAKAFAFELAWVQTILKDNIANLKDNLTLDLAPAKNGLHDVAKAFVSGIVASGKEALETYNEIATRFLSIAS